MKNFVYILLFISILPHLSSCVNLEQKKEIVSVTIQPQKYFAEKIADDLFDINCIVPDGSSPESYDPSPSHLVNVEKSSAYFKVGYLGFEMAWLDKLLQNNPKMKVYDNSTGMSLISGAHSCTNDTHVHSDANFDPHTWTSPRQAAIMAWNMYEAFIQLDPKHKKEYTQRYNALQQEISRADSLLTSIAPQLQGKTFAIYHPSLSYLARDYGLNQLSIENNGKEPSASYMKEAIDLAKAQEVKIVFIQKEFDKKNVEVFAKETGCKIVEINPLNYNWSEEINRLVNILKNEYTTN